jgi:hypothetical protein
MAQVRAALVRAARRGPAGTSWLLAMLLLAACTAHAVILADRAPPPRQVEEEPRPESGYVWVRGDWEWQGSMYRWRPGHFQRSRGNEYEWIDGHWQRQDGRYAWIEGHWQRSAGGGGGRGRVIIHDHGGH